MAVALTQALESVAIARLIRDHPLFASLPDEMVGDLVRRSRQFSFEPGDPIVLQGAASDAIYLVVAGEAEVLVDTAYGPVQVARLSSSTLFGEIGVFAGLKRTATVRARCPTRALRIERDHVLALGRENPDLLLFVISHLGARMDTVNRAIAFYDHALGALERRDFDPAILDELMHPVPELVTFAESFRRMAQQIVLKRAQHEEMANAAIIQRAMLPPPLPAESCDGRVELHADIRPAREVGGDFYDFFVIDEDRLGLAIGDVSGKGVPASLFLAITRTVIRLVARAEDDLAIGIGRANELLCAENASSMFATVFYGVLDCASGTLTYCNCGHNPPLVVRADGATEPLTCTGLPLAMLPEAAYAKRSLTLAPGDRLLLYTDGVTEAMSAADVEFGDARLGAAIEEFRRGSARDLVEGTLQRVAEFSQGVPQSDDQACLALVYAPRR
ncbi:MAG: PP2C family protein-serine/threonine phosphatase [Stellaceae bacterium]